MASVHSLIEVMFVIGVSQAAIILPPPPLSPVSLEDAHYSDSSNDVPHEKISNLQLLSPIFVPELTNKKSKQRHRERAVLFEPMLPFVERDTETLFSQPPEQTVGKGDLSYAMLFQPPLVEKESPMLPLVERDMEKLFLQSPKHTIGKEDIIDEKPEFDVLIQYNENDDDDDDGRQRQKQHRSKIESSESESTESGNVSRIFTITGVNSENSSYETFEQLKAVCAHFPNAVEMARLRLWNLTSADSGFVSGLMKMLCGILFKDTVYSSPEKQALNFQNYRAEIDSFERK